jgi:fused signal recognition particle receptor
MEFITLFGTPKKKNRPFSRRSKRLLNRPKKTLAEQIQICRRPGKKSTRICSSSSEAIMIGADIGVSTTNDILKAIKDRCRERPCRIRRNCEAQSKKNCENSQRELHAAEAGRGRKLLVILIVGVNESAKTTTIGKLANRFQPGQQEGHVVPPPTFRAAAIEQLEIWANRANVPIVKQKPNADPSAVPSMRCSPRRRKTSSTSSSILPGDFTPNII